MSAGSPGVFERASSWLVRTSNTATAASVGTVSNSRICAATVAILRAISKPSSVDRER